MESSRMHQLATWGTEVEILAAAKIIHRMSTITKGTSQRFAYEVEKSPDAMFLDNRSGCHFNVVIGPGNLSNSIHD